MWIMIMMGGITAHLLAALATSAKLAHGPDTSHLITCAKGLMPARISIAAAHHQSSDGVSSSSNTLVRDMMGVLLSSIRAIVATGIRRDIIDVGEVIKIGLLMISSDLLSTRDNVAGE